MSEAAKREAPPDECFTCHVCGSGPWHYTWFFGNPARYSDGRLMLDYRTVKNGMCPNCTGAT